MTVVPTLVGPMTEVITTIGYFKAGQVRVYLPFVPKRILTQSCHSERSEKSLWSHEGFLTSLRSE